MKKARAHQSDGGEEGIQASIHIDPADHPEAGKEAKFFFTFIDPEGTFEIGRCDCFIELIKDGAVIDEQPINIPNSSFAALGSYPLYIKTIIDPGNYQLHLKGEPKDGAVFNRFELNFDVQVVKANEGAVSVYNHSMVHEHLGHILIFGGGLVIAIAMLIRNYYENRNKQSN